ncbi:hypothetical protein BJF79_27480 [Actinomadura sp. CNU-125]|uniref:FAD-dependent monooxygenase n=1 Tax=Actinomadura sp. CNU-125 TaxID=1904961 RepID=UPI00095F57AC|nr:FAD-dependent monooxygenase [Actinomadura sp. CNU-125]OLT38281.1 hypothetical protein BJF79_27480 [Actinomadura sp. CNU-125]
MKNTNVLVSGASIAGPSPAYWLDRYGFEATIVERAPGVRPGGQAIDVRGPALDVAERLGVLDELRGTATGLRGTSVVDDEGAEVFRTTERTELLRRRKIAGARTSRARPDIERHGGRGDRGTTAAPAAQPPVRTASRRTPAGSGR